MGSGGKFCPETGERREERVYIENRCFGEGQREREDADADGKMDVDVSPEPEENMAEDGSPIEDSAGKADPKGNGTGDDVDELEYI